MKLIKSIVPNLQKTENSFDSIRLIAAVFVLIAHSPVVLLGKELSFDPIKEIFGYSMGHFGVLVFFIISGFWITKSWSQKKHLIDFVLARLLRLFPLLIFVILATVFIIGIALTSLETREYLRHQTTLKYLQNSFIFRSYYHLPGVYNSHVTSSLNGSIWTLPHELFSYCIITLLGIFQAIKYKYVSLVLFVIILFLKIYFNNEIDQIVVPVIGVDFKHFFDLFIYFFSGSIFYSFRKQVVFNIPIAIGGVVILYLNTESVIFEFLSFLLLPYFILTIGFIKNKFNYISRKGDFSYGIYLCSFPIQQLIIELSPKELSIIPFTIITILLTFLISIGTWFLIEKPSIRLRRKIFS